MSIVSNSSYNYYFTYNDSRTYTYTNTGVSPVKLTSISFYIGSALGTVNHRSRSDISYVSVSKGGSTEAIAKAALFADSNWNWSTLTGYGTSYSASASVSYNGVTVNCDSSQTVSGTASANVGSRITSNITYTTTYPTSSKVICTINPTGQTASQTGGSFTYSGSATTFTFANSSLYIPAGESATVTLSVATTNGYAVGFVFKDGTATPSVVEDAYVNPSIETYSATVGNTYNDKILPGASTVRFQVTTSNAATYKITDNVTTLSSGSIASNAVDVTVTIPSDSSGTIIFTAISAAGIEVSRTETYTYSSYTKATFSNTPVSKRCTSTGVEDDEGAYAYCSVAFTNAQVDGVDIPTTATATVNSVPSSDFTTSPLTAVINANMSTTQSYTVTYTLNDTITTKTKTDTISVSKYIMHFKENSVGILTYADTTDDVLRIGATARPVTIKINDNVLSAYVLAEGTSGIWTFRKWSNGDYECWTSQDLTVSSWDAWGGLYNSTQKTGPLTFPITFTAVPMIQVTAYSSQGSVIAESEGNAPTTTQTGVYGVSRGTTGGTWFTSATFNIYVKGKWQ